MATRTGRLVVDPRTGKMVEEYKEDQMAVALFDPECTKPEDYKFRFVLRSDFTVPKINLLFECNAALLKDPFGNVMWPKD
ncbi:peptidylprolyl isomerase [Phytophthora cinnamomi]|nr:peptidylprolyl isomerase [Phytophthora cinnamomi]